MQQQEVRAGALERRLRGRRRSRAVRNALFVTTTLFLTASAAFSFPTLANGYADSLFGHVTILNNPKLVTSLQAAQAAGVVMAVHGWRHENFSQLTPAEAAQLVSRSIAVFHQAGLVPRAFVEPYDSVLPPAVAAAIEREGLPIALPYTQPYEFLTAPYEYLYTWGWRNLTSYSDPRFVGAEAMIIQQQPRYVVLHVQDWNNYSKRLMQTYLGSTARTDVVVRVDDLDPNTSPAVVNDMTTLLKYRSLQELAFAVIPSAPLYDNPSVGGIGTNLVLSGYWVFYAATAFLPACFLFMWRSTSDDDPDPEGSRHLLQREEHPKVSIVIPAYNEEARIEECIGAALGQDYAGPIEVVVVNDGSTDGTLAKASKFPVKIMDQKVNRGKATALNTGVSQTTGDIIVFSDSDSRMAKDSVRLLVEFLQRNRGISAVAGCLTVNGRHNLLTLFQAVEYRIGQEVDKFLQGRSGGVLVCPGPLFAVRRDIALQFPFNDQSVIEDTDFTARLLKAGLQVGLENRAAVYTNVPRTVAAWAKQRKRWWAGFLEVWKAHKPWSRKNSWMLQNYTLGYVVSVISVALLLLIPFLAAVYAVPNIEVERGLLFAVFPIAFFTALYAPFLMKEKKLILVLPLYATVYFLMKTFLLASLYLKYLLRMRYHVQFGSRKVLVRW